MTKKSAKSHGILRHKKLNPRELWRKLLKLAENEHRSVRNA